jgi:phosphoserine phosphatase
MTASGIDTLVVQAPDIETPVLKALAHRAGASSIEAIPGLAHQGFRLAPASKHDGIAELAREAKVDWAIVPAAQRRNRVRLVVMDMDSTLITIECIDEIAAAAGIKPQIAAITERAMRGELDFRQSLLERVALLKGLDASALQDVYDRRLRLSPGAERMLAGFRAVGAKTLLASGGFTFFTDRLQARLQLDATVSNTLGIVGGKLTGRISGDIVDAEVKALRTRDMTAKYRGNDGLTVAIGDGANDLPMLEQADVSIAYRAKPLVRARATYAIDYCGLDAALNLFP